MMDLPTMVDSETLLAVDVGSVHTRASLFDVVDNQYRLVATGRSLSTATTPLLDIGEGVRIALDQVQTITGRRLLDDFEGLIMPSTSQGAGVDVFVATSSAGPRLRAVLVGLTPGVSLESGRRLATSTYLDVVEEIGLADRRREEEQIDLILATRPDLILIVGGTDGGASASVLRLVEGVAMAAGLRPGGPVPRGLFAGNRQLGAAIVERFADRTSVSLAPNVRPGLEGDDLTPAPQPAGRGHRRTTRCQDLRLRRDAPVVGRLRDADGGCLRARAIRHLSQTYDPRKGVLGVDIGASQTTIAAGFGGDLRLTVRTDLGLGAPLPSLLRHTSIEFDHALAAHRPARRSGARLHLQQVPPSGHDPDGARRIAPGIRAGVPGPADRARHGARRLAEGQGWTESGGASADGADPGGRGRAVTGATPGLCRAGAVGFAAANRDHHPGPRPAQPDARPRRGGSRAADGHHSRHGVRAVSSAWEPWFPRWEGGGPAGLWPGSSSSERARRRWKARSGSANWSFSHWDRAKSAG